MADKTEIKVCVYSSYMAKNRTTIEQNFFESGHSENEGDTMHACIQRKFNKKDIYLPSGYHDAMMNAVKTRKNMKFL